MAVRANANASPGRLSSAAAVSASGAKRCALSCALRMSALDRFQQAAAALASNDLAAVTAAHDAALSLMATHRPARALAARLYDRMRVLAGRPQKFGTQRGPDSALWPTDPGTTDSERAKWDLPGLADLLRGHGIG